MHLCLVAGRTNKDFFTAIQIHLWIKPDLLCVALIRFKSLKDSDILVLSSYKSYVDESLDGDFLINPKKQNVL